MNTNTLNQQIAKDFNDKINQMAKENALPGLEIYYKEGYMRGFIEDLTRDVPGVAEYLLSTMKGLSNTKC